MKLCLHLRGPQPRRKKVKKKQPVPVLTWRQKRALERIHQARARVGPAYVIGGLRAARAAMNLVLDAEISFLETKEAAHS